MSRYERIKERILIERNDDGGMSSMLENPEWVLNDCQVEFDCVTD